MPLETISIERYPARGWVCEVEARDQHGSMRRTIREAQSFEEIWLATREAYYSIATQERPDARKPDQAAQAILQTGDAEVHRDEVASTGSPPEAPRPASRPTLSLQDRDQRLRR